MCQVFISADPALYTCRARSVRLHGVATSIRLENLFWQVLEEIAARDSMSMKNYFATMMVYSGYADGMVSGAIHTTQETIRPALQIIKTNCEAREQFVATPVSMDVPLDNAIAYPMEVHVGGATVFVLPVDSFHRF